MNEVKKRLAIFIQTRRLVMLGLLSEVEDMDDAEERLLDQVDTLSSSASGGC